MVFSGRAHPELAEEVAELLGAGLVPSSAYDFAAAHVLLDLDGGFAIREAADRGFAQLDAEVGGDFLGERRVGVASEENGI